MTMIDDIKNKVAETAKNAIKKSNEIVEIAKINLAIGDSQSRINSLLRDVGKIIYDAYKAGDYFAEEISSKCLEIDEIVDNVNNLRKKLCQLKNIKICPQCEKENERDACFCSRCGYRIEDEAEDKME
ncbi:MAG: hypothetical protein GX066_08795 [Clostridiaceae bacterium]|nr:hypothetical protein [Clostridiaceae bacterium]